jgi:hypothetical protein
MKLIDQDLVQKLLIYNPDTGVFTWRQSPNWSIKIGSAAGCVNPYGYRLIRINKTSYMAHRLAWVYIHGSILEGCTVDHINGDRDNNVLGNLRLAKGHKEQAQNQKKRSDNTSGCVGVYPHKIPNTWIAQIRVNGKALYLGIYPSIEEASEAYKKAKIEHHPFNPIQR